MRHIFTAMMFLGMLLFTQDANAVRMCVQNTQTASATAGANIANIGLNSLRRHGRVVSGSITTTFAATRNAGTTLFTLPVGFRPSDIIFVPIYGQTGLYGDFQAERHSVVQIATNGVIAVHGRPIPASVGQEVADNRFEQRSLTWFIDFSFVQ